MTGFTLMRQASVGVTVSRGVMYRENFTLGKSTENVSLPNKAFEAHPKRGIYGQNPPAVPLLNRGATTSY